MQTQNPFLDEFAKLTTAAMGIAQAAGEEAKAALLSHSSFGTSDSPSARKMRKALALLRESRPDFEIDGEMHADAALSDVLRARYVSNSPLTGSASLMVMPTLGCGQYRTDPAVGRHRGAAGGAAAAGRWPSRCM